MKILIIGDSHGHIANLSAVMEIAKKSEINAVVHPGDWDNIKSVEAVLNFGMPLYTVMGNADVEEGLEEFMKFNAKDFNPSFLRIILDGRRIGITHKVKKADKFEDLDVVFSGHYHSKNSRMVDFVRLIRPGAIINGINFAVYDTATNEVKFVEDV